MQRNVILFVVLSSVILAAWFYYTTTLMPSKKIEPKPIELAQKKSEAGPEFKKEEKKTTVKTTQEKEAKKEAKKEEKKEEIAREEKEDKNLEPLKTVTLGGESFHLTVDLITRGAAVRRVQLNRFKAANWLGEPTDRELQLIQDDEFSPSFRMYHYLDPQDENPVFGLGEKNWKLLKSDTKEAQFTTTVPGRDDVTILKTYRLDEKAYHIGLLLEFVRKTDNSPPMPFRYQLTGGQGLPIEGEWYASTFRNAFMGLVDPRGSLWRKLEDSARISAHKGGDRYPADKLGDNRMQYAGTANQFFASMLVVDNVQPARSDGGVDPAKIVAWARPTLETTEKRGTIIKIRENEVWFRDDFVHRGEVLVYKFLPRTKRHFKDLDLQENQKAVLSYYELPDGRAGEKLVASWVRLGETLRPQFDDVTVRSQSEVVTLEPGIKVAHQFMLYHGPIKAALLSQFYGDEGVPPELVERYTQTLYLRTLTDYPNDNWFGWLSSKIMLTDVIILFTRLMHWLLNLLHYVFGYGLSIVVLTLMVRGAMFPISRKQAMFSIKMQEVAPELKKIQAKFPDDPTAKMQATQEFYRKHNINPLGSCWPVFLQMPIFLGLYFALQESIHFRLANFLWIDNLAAPDMLIYWTENIPLISSPDHAAGVLSILYLGPFLNILPLCAAGLMFVQQTQTMPPPTDEQQAMQQNMMKYMTIFFGIMFYKVAAGMCIYFITSSLWGVAERKLLPKKKHLAAADQPAPPATGITAKAPPYYPKGKPKVVKKEKIDESTLDKIKHWWQEVLRQAEKK